MVTYTTNRRSGPELPERQRSASRACANNSPSGGGTPWHCSAPQQQLQERRGIRTQGGTASIPVHRWRLARHTAHRKREGKCPGRGKVMQDSLRLHPPANGNRERTGWRRKTPAMATEQPFISMHTTTQLGAPQRHSGSPGNSATLKQVMTTTC